MQAFSVKAQLLVTVLLSIQQLQSPCTAAAAGSFQHASTVPLIRDDMITLAQALESALICKSLIGMNQSNFHAKTLPQYTVLAYGENNSSTSQHQHNVILDNGITTTTINKETNDNESTYWIGNSTDQLFVAFRGSLRIQDALEDQQQIVLGPPDREVAHKMLYANVTDASEPPIEVDVMVHRGFNSATFSNYINITNVIHPLLKRSSSEQQFARTVTVVGHGLGGAQAALFATYYAYHHPTTAVIVHTFGQPRCGNYGFKILQESIPNLNVWRLVNQHDVVTRVPFRNYHHAGHLIWKTATISASNDNDTTSMPTHERSEKDENTTTCQAFSRTVGDATLGYSGLEDISLAFCRGMCDGMADQFKGHHDLTTGILPWLTRAAEEPEACFPTEFHRLRKFGQDDSNATDVEEASS